MFNRFERFRLALV